MLERLAAAARARADRDALDDDRAGPGLAGHNQGQNEHGGCGERHRNQRSDRGLVAWLVRAPLHGQHSLVMDVTAILEYSYED